MKIFYYLLTIVSLACFSPAKADITYHKGEVEDGYDFILYEPEPSDRNLNHSAKKPLIISLHSRKASGNNLMEVDIFGTIDALRSGMSADAIVLAPQTPTDRWDPEKIVNTVDYVSEKFNVDKDKISAIGMSMGGNGVIDLIENYPHRIASAAVLGAGKERVKAEEVDKVPLWIVRGMEDRAMAIQRTEKMISEIRNAGGSRLVYTPLKGVDHRGHERILYMPKVYRWLTSHSLSDRNRPVHKVPKL